MTATFGERLKGIREEMKLSLSAFGDLAGVTGTSQGHYEKDARSPDIRYLERIKEHGIDVDFLLWGHPPTGHRNLSGSAPAPANDDDTIHVPLLSATGSMGPGNELLTEDVLLGDVPLSRHWIAAHLPRCRSGALKLIHAYGDSMQGTLDSGDFALVDTDTKEVLVDGVYVLEAHNRLFIKRVRQRLDGRFEVSSDNESIKTSDILDGSQQISVLGRVVYGWNGRRF